MGDLTRGHVPLARVPTQEAKTGRILGQAEGRTLWVGDPTRGHVPKARMQSQEAKTGCNLGQAEGRTLWPNRSRMLSMPYRIMVGL